MAIETIAAIGLFVAAGLVVAVIAIDTLLSRWFDAFEDTED